MQNAVTLCACDLLARDVAKRRLIVVTDGIVDDRERLKALVEAAGEAGVDAGFVFVGGESYAVGAAQACVDAMDKLPDALDTLLARFMALDAAERAR